MAINNINYQTIYSTQIYLNSESADIYMNSSKHSNVAFFFTDPLKIDKTAIEMRLSVVNAQFPVSWYQINETNNKINIAFGSANAITYYITPGNYNVNTFITQWAYDVNSSFVITYNSITNKYQFSYPGQITFSDDTNSLFTVIGFQVGSSYTSSSNYINSIYPVNFGGLRSLSVKTSTFSLKNIDSNNKGLNRTVACIPVSAAQNGIVFYNNITNYKNVFKNRELSSIDIQICDLKRNYIDFNNQHWGITLQIDIVNEIVESFDNLNDIYSNLKQEF